MTIERHVPIQGLIPKCPHCLKDMPRVSWNTNAPTAVHPDGPPLAFMVFFCPLCRVAFSCQLLPLSQAVSPGAIDRASAVG